MKLYGPAVAEGSEVTNLTIPSGETFPDNLNVGELFFKSDEDTMYICGSGSPTWNAIVTSNAIPINESPPSNNAAIWYNNSTGFLEYDSVLPTSLLNSDVVLTSGTQSIGGTKTFTAVPTININGGAYINYTNSSIPISAYAGVDNVSYFAGTITAHPFLVYTQNAVRGEVTAAGAWIINAPSSGEALSVEGNVRSHLASSLNTTFRGLDLGIVGTSTAYGSVKMNINSGELRYNAGFDAWGGYHTFYTDGDERMNIGPGGNVTINAPDSGTALYVNSLVNNNAQIWTDGVTTLTAFTLSTPKGGFGTGTTHDFGLYSNSLERIVIGSAGNVTIHAPSSGGDALTVSGFITSTVGGTAGFKLGNTAASSGNRNWRMHSSGTSLTLGPSSDDFSSTSIALTIDRSSASVTAMQYGSVSTDHNFVGDIRFSSYGAGTLQTDASGNVTASSDIRIKNNIRPFSRGIADINKIDTIMFGYKPESKLDQTKTDYVGFSAQNVQSAIPEAVGEMKDGTLTVNDRPILAALVNAVKQLASETTGKQIQPQAGGLPSNSTVINAGSGMKFPSITKYGNVSLGTPSSITLDSANVVTSDSHTHKFNPGGNSAQYIRGDGTLGEYVKGMTSVSAGEGLHGGTITDTGTISIDYSRESTWTKKHTFESGIRVGSSSAVDCDTVTGHIDFGNGTGLNVVDDKLNYVVPGKGTHDIRVGQRTMMFVDYNGITVAGTIKGTLVGNVASPSDITLKQNIVTIDGALSKLDRVSGVYFDWKSSGNRDVGVIAQQVQEVLPEVVITQVDGTLAVKYDKLVPLLIESIKELKAELDRVKRFTCGNH